MCATGWCLWAGRLGDIELGGVGSMPERAGAEAWPPSWSDMGTLDVADCAANATAMLEMGLLAGAVAMLTAGLKRVGAAADVW